MLFSLHPLDVLDFFLLDFKVVPSLPVLLALHVLFLKKIVLVLAELVNFLLDLFSFTLDINLILLDFFHLLPELFNLSVLHIELCLDSTDLYKQCLFLCVELVRTRLEE